MRASFLPLSSISVITVRTHLPERSIYLPEQANSVTIRFPVQEIRITTMSPRMLPSLFLGEIGEMHEQQRVFAKE